MAAHRKEVDDLDPAAAEGKLSRLLDTETELDAMLQEAKRGAAELIEAARTEAEDRILRFEMELESAELELRDQVARERDDAIAAIRAETMRAAESLDALDGERIAELAQYVLARVVGTPPGGQS